MAELLPAALGWIDQQKKAAFQKLADAVSEVRATPLEAIVNGVRGAARGGMQMAEMAGSVIPGFPSTEGSLTDRILPSNGSAIGDIGEMLGPPMKLGAKALAGLGMAALPLHAAQAAHAAEELPTIDKSMLFNQPSLPPTRPSNQLLDALMAHGLDAGNVGKIQKYTRESNIDVLQRMEDAQSSAVRELGLPANNTAQDRARAMGYPDIGDPSTYMMRGSSTPRAVLKTPREAGVASAHSPRQMDVVFMSEPGGTAYQSFPPDGVHTPLVSATPHEAYFDPANEAHQDAFIQRFDELHPGQPHPDNYPGEGDPYNGTMMVESWKNHVNPRKAWEDLETDPRVAGTIKDLGYPGFITDELGTNRAVFDPTDLRHPLAAFDPSKRGVRNLFAGAGGASLAALLASQGLPVQTPESQ